MIMVMPSTENKIRRILGKRVSKEVDFMGEKLSIHKLSVNQILEIQTLVKDNEVKSKTDVGLSERDSFKTVQRVLSLGCPEFAELNDEEFDSLPLDDLNKLSEAILEFSGMSNKGN
jgi:hypothetical protein